MTAREAAAQRYRDFAVATAGQSACFEAWSTAVAGDAEVLDWIGRWPGPKQQPNLIFAAARWHGVPAPGPYAGLRDALLGDRSTGGGGTIAETIRSRSTQTNEVGRLATIVPAFAGLAARQNRPLALLEVGASAGLCLYPDRYDYAWPPRGRLVGSGGPELRCDVRGPVPVPEVHPVVAWRGGIDLHPLDVRDEDAMAWLTTLVWPEQDERRARLTAAIEVARREPPQLVTGDLLEQLPSRVEAAGTYGLVVVFHSAVLSYLDDDRRAAFSTVVRSLVADGACHWVSNEGVDVLPEVTRTASGTPPDGSAYVLGVDGRAVAWTHQHGASMTWL